MLDPNLALLNAYQTALNGLTVDGTAIPLYPALVPLTNSNKKYVLLTTQTRQDNKTKCGYWWDCQITVDIVTKYPNGRGDIMFAMNIGQSISALVQDVVISVTGFNIRDCRQLTPEILALQTDTEDIYRYLLTFTYKINRAA